MVVNHTLLVPNLVLLCHLAQYVIDSLLYDYEVISFAIYMDGTNVSSK